MAATLWFSSNIGITPHVVNSQRQCRRNYCHKIYRNRIRCSGDLNTKSTEEQESAPENVLLKVAWYGSELLGIAASFVRPPSNVEEAAQNNIMLANAGDGSGAIDRTSVVQTIKDDFERSYFVTGKW